MVLIIQLIYGDFHSQHGVLASIETDDRRLVHVDVYFVHKAENMIVFLRSECTCFWVKYEKYVNMSWARMVLMPFKDTH